MQYNKEWIEVIFSMTGESLGKAMYPKGFSTVITLFMESVPECTVTRCVAHFPDRDMRLKSVSMCPSVVKCEAKKHKRNKIRVMVVS